MKVFRLLVAGACVAGALLGAAQAEEISEIISRDAPRASDHPLAGRYQGAIILGQMTRAFDELVFPAGPIEDMTANGQGTFAKVQAARGRITRTLYLAPAERSTLEVFSNHQDKLTASGFAPVFACAGDECGKNFGLAQYGQEKAHIRGENYHPRRGTALTAAMGSPADVRYALMKKSTADGDSYAALFVALDETAKFGGFLDGTGNRARVMLEMVEPRVMEKRMVTISASEIGSKIAADGRAVFNNVLFDFDKAVIKPESLPQIDQMAAFLKSNPGFKALVVGHTDNKGGLDYNLKLSDARAASVMQALTQRGIDKSRLAARGAGSLSPVATNRTDDGREQNRRVELVEQ